MNLRDPRIRVILSTGELRLSDGPELVKTYRCITGSNHGDKEKEGDHKTPLGLFRVVFRNPQSKFHLSLGLNYPDESDAKRGLETGLLTQERHRQLMNDLEHGDMNDPAVQDRVWKTPLGGEIFIHGGAQGRTGTAGCLALTDADIAELYPLCPIGTPVEIVESI
ncbi:MAG TPA: L,D-transpeptidase [Phycisphaerae bacterium]|nr:L,D-transpeptidase [Phycisphaerae bacterium]